jgi:hypothetical protein
VILLPGATYDPGVHWNYQAGQISPINVFWHYTVGRDSRGIIRDRGLAPILVWDQTIWEFAPLDAQCYTQCEWNRRGPGIEVESLDGSISPAQIANLGYVTLFCLTTFGIPQVFHQGYRLPVGDPFRGVTNHRDLRHNACDMHSDGFDYWVWEAALGSAPPKKKGVEMTSFLCHELYSNSIWLVDPNTLTKVYIKSWDAFLAEVQFRQLVAYFGGSADPNLHRTDELVNGQPIWGNLWAEARDVDTFND